MDCGQRLDTALRNAGMTQGDLAAKMGIKSPSITQLKAGVFAAPDRWKQIASLLNAPVEWLLYGTGTPPDWAQSRPTVGKMTVGKGERSTENPGTAVEAYVPAQVHDRTTSADAAFDALMAEGEGDTTAALLNALLSELRTLRQATATGLVEIRREIAALRKAVDAPKSPAAAEGPPTERLSDLAATMPSIRGAYQLGASIPVPEVPVKADV